MSGLAEDMEKAAIRTFFSSPRFAVAGASSDVRKFGHRVFAWYLDHSLPVTPLNPTTPRITVPSTRRSSRSISTSDDYATTFSPSHLQPKPSDFSLSVITPPAVTRKLLEEAERAGVRAVWLQPGSFDGETLGWAREVWKGACVGGGGACVLVQGEEGMELAGRVGDGEGMAESGKL